MLKQPRLPIWIICSESHYSILFSVDSNAVSEKNSVQSVDLIYYDELAKQEYDIILSLEKGQYTDEDRKK